MRRAEWTRHRESVPFELQTLTALPCGCVAADFRAEILDVELVSIEAKGPHCHLAGHSTNGVLGLGETGELDTHQLDDLTVPLLAT